MQDTDALADRLADTEALVLIRERTLIRTPLLERLPELRLISQRSVYPHIDVDTCTRLGIVVSSDLHQGSPSYATAELTWGLVIAAMRRMPQQVASHEGRSVAGRGGDVPGVQDARDLGYGRIGRVVARLRPGLRHARWSIWASEEARARAGADGFDVGRRAARRSSSSAT